MNPGIYQIDADTYHADPCDEPSLSASVAHVLLTETPAHARLAHPRLNPNHVEDNDSKFTAGRVLHALFLEGENRMDVFRGLNGKGDVATAWQTNESKAFKAEAFARGRIPVLAHEELEFLAALDTLWQRIETLEDKPAPFTNGKPEQTLIWQEPNGVWCRARPDWLHDDAATIDDLKTCASANPGNGFGDFGRAVETLGHYVQEAFYRRGVAALFDTAPVFRFIAFELDGPGITCDSLSARYRAIGDSAVARAIALWGDCLSRNDWPGYPRYRIEIEPPERLAAREEEEMCL